MFKLKNKSIYFRLGIFVFLVICFGFLSYNKTEAYYTNMDSGSHYYNNHASNYYYSYTYDRNNNDSQNYINSSGPIWYDEQNINQNSNTNGNNSNQTSSTAVNKTSSKTTTKTNTAATTKDKTANTINLKGENSAGALTANALWGSNTFLPSGFAQWFFFFVLLILAIILWRKLYLNSREKHSPLKHA